MLTTRHLASLCLLAALVLAGCSRTRPLADRPGLPNTFPNHTLEQIQIQLRPTALDTLQAFRAKASLAVRTPQQSASLSADLRHRRADSLYMTVSPGLGIEAARVLVTPDSFFVYDRIKKRVTYGPVAYANDYLPAPLAGDDVFLALLGLLPPEATTAWELEADTSTYVLRDPDRDRFFVIDPTVWRVVRYEERDDAGALVEQRLFESFDLVEDVFLPRRVVLRRPQDETTATLYYRDLNLNPLSLSFPFQTSSSAEWVLVQPPSGSR